MVTGQPSTWLSVTADVPFGRVALIFGNAITILIFIFAGISGANINPAVSFALALTQTISPARAICYAVAQCIGAVAGAGFVRIMTPTLFDQVREPLSLATSSRSPRTPPLRPPHPGGRGCE